MRAWLRILRDLHQMKPVDQTRFGYPEGNCLMSCVASVLEVELDALPDLFDRCCKQDGEGDWSDTNENWWKVLEEGVTVHGWEAHYALARDDAAPPLGHHVAGGPAGRAFDEDGKDAGHCVVCLDGVMVHDPHHSRDGIGAIEDWILLKRIEDEWPT